MRSGRFILLLLLPFYLFLDTGCKTGARLPSPAERTVYPQPEWPPVLVDTLIIPDRVEISEIADDSHLPYISLIKSGCFGRCPAYAVDIFSDGTVYFHGKAHTNKVGKFVGRINPAVVIQMLQLSREGGFSKLPSSIPETMYRSEYFNATILSMRTTAGNFHTVTYWYGEPALLRDIEEMILREIGRIEMERY